MYRFISDPGHGWLAVPLSEVKAMPIRITAFSYVDTRKGTAYLEEDVDAGAFVEAKIKAESYPGSVQDWMYRNVQFTTVDHTNIRNLSRYH